MKNQTWLKSIEVMLWLNAKHKNKALASKSLPFGRESGLKNRESIWRRSFWWSWFFNRSISNALFAIRFENEDGLVLEHNHLPRAKPVRSKTVNDLFLHSARNKEAMPSGPMGLWLIRSSAKEWCETKDETCDMVAADGNTADEDMQNEDDEDNAARAAWFTPAWLMGDKTVLVSCGDFKCWCRWSSFKHSTKVAIPTSPIWLRVRLRLLMTPGWSDKALAKFWQDWSVRKLLAKFNDEIFEVGANGMVGALREWGFDGSKSSRPEKPWISDANGSRNANEEELKLWTPSNKCFAPSSVKCVDWRLSKVNDGLICSERHEQATKKSFQQQ